MISWSKQIANGMDYLSSRKVVHGDLACRNILLARNNVVKISDFGLAKYVEYKEYYKNEKQGPLPIKWLSIETLDEGWGWISCGVYRKNAKYLIKQSKIKDMYYVLFYEVKVPNSDKYKSLWKYSHTIEN